MTEASFSSLTFSIVEALVALGVGSAVFVKVEKEQSFRNQPKPGFHDIGFKENLSFNLRHGLSRRVGRADLGMDCSVSAFVTSNGFYCHFCCRFEKPSMACRFMVCISGQEEHQQARNERRQRQQLNRHRTVGPEAIE